MHGRKSYDEWTDGGVFILFVCELLPESNHGAQRHDDPNHIGEENQEKLLMDRKRHNVINKKSTKYTI